jgi:hypothetical protein
MMATRTVMAAGDGRPVATSLTAMSRLHAGEPHLDDPKVH